MSLFGALAGVAWWWFGPPAAALAWVRGDVITVSPAIVDLKQGKAGELKAVEVAVWNWTERPIRLLGGTGNCSCTVLDDLPALVPPHTHKLVRIRVRYLPGTGGEFTRTVTLLTDAKEARIISFLVTGVVDSSG